MFYIFFYIFYIFYIFQAELLSTTHNYQQHTLAQENEKKNVTQELTLMKQENRTLLNQVMHAIKEQESLQHSYQMLTTTAEAEAKKYQQQQKVTTHTALAVHRLELEKTTLLEDKIKLEETAVANANLREKHTSAIAKMTQKYEQQQKNNAESKHVEQEEAQEKMNTMMQHYQQQIHAGVQQLQMVQRY